MIIAYIVIAVLLAVLLTAAQILDGEHGPSAAAVSFVLGAVWPLTLTVGAVWLAGRAVAWLANRTLR